jgi:hypothetical protein
MAHCKQTADYFQTVETDFNTTKVIESVSTVIVIGTAEFKRDGNRLSFISACDVYEFNLNNEIEQIDSYCITE